MGRAGDSQDGGRSPAAARAPAPGTPSESALRPRLDELRQNPAQPAETYRDIIRQLYLLGRYAEAESWSAEAVGRHAATPDLWSLRGVMLRQRNRPAEALAALDRAIALDPSHLAAQANRGNVLMDLGRATEAEAVFAGLLGRDPGNAAVLRLHGQALARLGRRDAAIKRFDAALAAAPGLVEGWLDLAGVLTDLQRSDEAQAALERGLALNPRDPRLLEAKALVMRGAGQLQRAIAFLQALLADQGETAWLQFQLGNLVGEYDRDAGNAHLRRAVALEPDNLDYLTALAQGLERTRGAGEGADIEEACQLARRAAAIGGLSPGHTKVLTEVFTRVCAFDDMAEVGDFRTLGRGWAATGRQTTLLKQMARVHTHADRLELLEQHRIWGRQAEALAEASPIRRPAPRAADGRIRLGFLSSDLRRHPVSYYALPLFDHVDPDRFELYAYSFALTPEDELQRHIASRVKAFRWMPDVSPRQAAQAIADDQLDMLIELGGSTQMNRPEVLAWRPAPRQASWLGYPHSVGLAAIDYFICDPFSAPASADLLIEAPLILDPTWIALGEAVFGEQHPITDGLPELRNGLITFGTANHPHKYSREVLRTWARVTAAAGGRFAFVRPEAGAPSFRRHVIAEFAAEGVPEDRLVFHPVRGRHMALYNEVDISLDTFPLTGGATTTESLWMGVPVVSLVGEAFFERLSYSILSNAGLADLCAFDLAAYEAAALRLAADRPRRQSLRRTLREQIRQGPLGRTEAFARNFYDTIARVVADPPRRS
jgi:predicted O-linked N-acetylglucosamine transferase (SPINDLY family)